MRIVISGASGTVGRQVVPILIEKGTRPLLVGRDPAALRALFPQCEAIGYPDIVTEAKGADLFVHLAVLNNNVVADYDAFLAINATLGAETCRQARAANVRRFLYVSSTHALDAANTTPYARSKREAARLLAEVEGIETGILHLPSVIGDRYSGRLGPLNRLPRPLARSLVHVLGALKPMVHATQIAETIVALANTEAALEMDMLVTDGQQDNRIFQVCKRCMDLAAAAAILVFLGWLMAIVLVLVRLDSPGPGLFRQTRVGRNGRPFTCFKFRTMRVDTPERGTHEIGAQAVTRLGRFLRRSKLDELPQIFNIFANQMSLVGPRPCLVKQTELIAERQARGVLALKPGITGLAQINGIDMSDADTLARWDERYLETQSLSLDAKLIILTLVGKGSGDRTRA